MLDARKKYEFKRKLEELREKIGKGTELITIYIPPDKQISDVVSQLRDEHGQASNIKSKSTRTNVQSALSSIMARLKYFRTPPENGMVLFCGNISLGGDKTTMETLVLEPPEPIMSYQYRCGSEFVLTPLEEMLEEKKNYGLLVLDRREATIGLLHRKSVETIKHMTSNVPGKQRKGGQSSRRFERLRLISINEFYKRIGDKASEIFLGIKDLEGILIGGPSPTKDEFIGGEYLHHELQQKILGVFDVSYTDESGLYELLDASHAVLADLDLMREKELMDRFLKEVVMNKGLAAYGRDSVKKNIKLGAVDILLISEDLNAELVAELSQLADQKASAIEFISTDFEEGEQLMNAFGGLAALLRFRTDI